MHRNEGNLLACSANSIIFIPRIVQIKQIQRSHSFLRRDFILIHIRLYVVFGEGNLFDPFLSLRRRWFGPHFYQISESATTGIEGYNNSFQRNLGKCHQQLLPSKRTVLFHLMHFQNQYTPHHCFQNY